MFLTNMVIIVNLLIYAYAMHIPDVTDVIFAMQWENYNEHG